MKSDETERELLRLAQDVADGRAVDWEVRSSTDPGLNAGVEGLREIEVLARALRREPEPLDSGAQARTWLEPGSMLGRYPVEREAGRGGMGVVYLARDQVLDRPVALKLLPPDMAGSPERLARFTREAKLLASLNHPNVATIHGLEESAGRRFLVLEWVAGESLAARLRRGPLPWREGLEVCGQIARGLAAAHEGGVIHRDLKPGNVMITPQGGVKVLDFGLARRGIAPGDLPAGPSDPAVKGTWGYVSPECLTRNEDQRADMFAFGCVLYECLSGAPAFPGDSVAEIQHALLHREPEEARLPADTPLGVRRLIASCVAKDPDRRLGSMAEALRTIEAALGRRLATFVNRAGAAAATPHRLPEETDVFVGREEELGALSGRLRRGARLVTLLGAGGMGKTRLAVRYGWRSLEEWPGGVWFCDLTEASTRDGIAGAVAGAMEVPLGNSDPVEQLGRAIAGRGPCLLVLDNFEQVVTEAGSTVARWLERAPEARFVVTSRERLGLSMEETQTIEPLGSEPGTELFVERVRTHRPGYEPEGPDAESAAEVVRLVEGIPLAIELAAARVRVMSPSQIVARMQERLRLLAGPGGGRHATLQAAIDGSWELLDPWEQAAFAQCAVFEGGFTLEAAEAVLDLRAWDEAPWLLDVVQSLVDKSLLRTWVPEREGSGAAMRFGMFVSLQDYAREKLVAAQGVEAARGAEERHGKWFAGYGSEEAIDALTGRDGVQRQGALARELQNLVAACRRAARRGDGETAVATYEAAWEVLQVQGPSATAVDLGQEVLPRLARDADRRRALTTLGSAEWRAGLVGEARAHLESALALHRAGGHRRWEGITLGVLGALHAGGRPLDSRAYLEAAIALDRELGDRRREGLELARLCLSCIHQGLMEESRAHGESALAIAREVGDRNLEGQVLNHLGSLNLEQGRLEESRARIESALAIARETSNRRSEGFALLNLGVVDANQHRIAEADAHFESALLIARQAGNRSLEGKVLGFVGTMRIDQGRMDEARSFLDSALAIFREVGDRIFEGWACGELGRMYLEQGRLEEARIAIGRSVLILRDAGMRMDLARLLCSQVRLEVESGDLGAARAILDEVEAIVLEAGAGPDSELGHLVAGAREVLAAKS